MTTAWGIWKALFRNWTVSNHLALERFGFLQFIPLLWRILGMMWRTIAILIGDLAIFCCSIVCLRNPTKEGCASLWILYRIIPPIAIRGLWSQRAPEIIPNEIGTFGAIQNPTVIRPIIG